jgi:hypothetical protein
MRFSHCRSSCLRVVAALAVLSAAVVSVALARPRPGKGFRLFSSAAELVGSNRVQCRIFAAGQLCATGSSVVGGGIWPKGTGDQYNFAGGLQIAGVVDPALPKSSNAFSGDTAGAFFYNTGYTSNGLAVRPIFSSADATDAAAWPDEALVPQGDASENIFDPTLRGKIAASQADRWFLSWEGDPSDLAGGRPHPLGIAVETRMLNWNFPSGNEDIVYFVFTFYNVTSSLDAPYSAIRPSLQPLIANQGKIFQAANVAKYGPIPDEGYTIKNIFVDVVNDMDVADYNLNFAGVNIPFALGYAYQADFSEASARGRGWTFDPAIFGSQPFFNGPGFVGVKYLLSPVNPATGLEVGLSQFNVFTNGGTLSDPGDDKQLYRYMTGGLLPSDGSGCNAPPGSHICAIDLTSPTDVRFLQASGPFDLAPGQFASIVVAYIYAAPVADGSCPGVACNVPPADGGNASRLDILGNPTRMNSGVNQVDRMTGYLDFNNAGPADLDPTRVTQEEFVVQRNSLLGKSLVAQTVFNNKFLLPFSPERPDFFLVPGDNQVTILWSKSLTESVPDPFFAIAKEPLNPDGTVNALYDPNFRGTDVEGYRIYRGRASNPSELTLIAQFDYAPDPFSGRGHFLDFRATVNPTPECAPEIDVFILCPVAYPPPPAPGNPFTVAADVDLVGTVTQVIPGDRVKLATGSAQILPGKLDTASADIARGRVAGGVSTELKNNGVPFLFVDGTVRNSLRYFYAVTAFDVNSVASGPSSLESGRVAKPVTPVRSPNNLAVTSSSVGSVLDRTAAPLTNTTLPTLDATTGKFSGPFPPEDPAAAQLGFATLVADVVNGTTSEFSVRLDSIQLGEAGSVAAFGNVFPTPNTYWYTAKPGTPDANVFSVPVDQATGGSDAGGEVNDSSGEGFFDGAADVSAANAARFEGAGGSFKLSGKMTMTLPAASYMTAQGIGCAFPDPGFTAGACSYNGPRWFDGPSPTTNETKNDPNAGNILLGGPLTDYNNAGQLTGVSVIYEPHAYTTFNREWRNLDWIFAGAARAADFNVYWGTGGKVDSVVDITHNVAVPFAPSMGGNWGILTQANSTGADAFDGRPDVLTVTDIGCVEPLKSSLGGSRVRIPCDTLAAVPAYQLDSIATLGTIAFTSDSITYAKSTTLSPPAPQDGLLFYLPGHVFLMQMPTLPAAGTIWSMRSYIGAISGGNGSEGNLGPYAFTPALRPFTAVGTQAKVTLSAAVVVNPTTKDDLSGVHTVPDPYYVQSKYEVSTDQKVLKFVGLPEDCIIRIYSVSGVLVRVIEHHAGNYSSTSFGQGSEHDWDLRNRNNQVVASGVYFWHVEAGDARKIGRFTVVNFAQ